MTIDHKRVREERQNFDPVGHYARPDVPPASCVYIPIVTR